MNSEIFICFSRVLESAKFTAKLSGTTPLVPEASTRRYYRLHLADSTTVIGVHEGAESAAVNMPNVLAVQKFLKTGGVSVPEIFYCDVAAGVMLQQDLGDLSLNQALREQPDTAELLYRQAIDHMLCWQRLRYDSECPAFRLSFDVEKLMFEFEFFTTHTLLGYYRAQPSEGDLSRLHGQFREVAETLAAPERKVFTHRDYHSRNIIVYCGAKPQNKQYIIDFQDARLGLFQYDLCSLLCDAYAPMTAEMRSRLLDYAFAAGKDIHAQSRTEFDHYWRLSAFQRIVKAMGTFGRQAALGRADFAANLNPAWQMLREISHASAELRPWVEYLENMAGNQPQNVF